MKTTMENWERMSEVEKHHFFILEHQAFQNGSKIEFYELALSVHLDYTISHQRSARRKYITAATFAVFFTIVGVIMEISDYHIHISTLIIVIFLFGVRSEVISVLSGSRAQELNLQIPLLKRYYLQIPSGYHSEDSDESKKRRKTYAYIMTQSALKHSTPPSDFD